jgi:hypothetical protein
MLFGNNCECKVRFRQKASNEMMTFAMGIEAIDQQTFGPNQTDAAAGS